MACSCTHLSNTLSILYCANILLVEYLDEGCHSPSTLRGAHCETVHILLDQEPLIHISDRGSPQLCTQILGLHIVSQLGDGGDVEDVKVHEIIVHQLSQHGLT